VNVALVRVDSRLVHGQIIEAWVPHVHADALVVLNDGAAGSALTTSIIEMCVPKTLRVVVAPVAEAGAVGARPDLADATAIVLVATAKDALAAHEAGLAFSRLNLGNLHFSPGKRQVSTCVSLGEEDRVAFGALEARGVAIEAQAVPRDRARPYHELAAGVR
jgi:mannose/fructose/N-acetylgalactosamine-specific phosphotransferase system component IIB